MHCWCGYTGTATRENNMEFPQKIRNRPTIGSINPTTGYVSIGNEILKEIAASACSLDLYSQ